MTHENSDLTIDNQLKELTENIEANNGNDVHPGSAEDTREFTFTIKELKHPGSWKRNHAIDALLNGCSSFELKFRMNDDQARKSGDLIVFFDDLKSAQDAYLGMKKCKIDGILACIEAPDCLSNVPESITTEQPKEQKTKEPFFAIPTDPALRERTVYALHLFPSTDKEIIDGIVGAQLVESVKFMPLGLHRQQAEVRICDASKVAEVSGDMEEFSLEDGDEKSEMRVYSCDDYAKFVSGEEKLEYFTVESTAVETVQTEVPDTSEAAVPEIDDEQVTEAILEHVESNRVNWAELNTREELYELCDIISSKFGGLPDSILKPAMLATLNRHLNDNPSHWMRSHLIELINVWTRESQSESHFNRSSEVVMSAPIYTPISPDAAKKRKYKNSKSGRAKLGVGAYLQQVKKCLETEYGKLDVDEDDSGNFSIDGKPLSFASWAEMTKTNEPDVVSMQQPKKRAAAGGVPMDMHDFKKLKQRQRIEQERRTGAKKMRIMKEARRELAALDENQAKENEMELDDGEILSDEEKKNIKEKGKKKKERNSSDSSSSSSSSSSESDDETPDARKRRRNRRKIERKKRGNKRLSQNPQLVQLYENRRYIVSMLPAEQRTGFAAILRQLGSSGAAPASNTMMQQASAMFSSFGR